MSTILKVDDLKVSFATEDGVVQAVGGVSFELRVVCRATPDKGASAAEVLTTPVIATQATGTVVVPQA